MPDRRGWDPPPAPRALGELPLEAALAHTERLAGAWVLALIRSRPLEEIGVLPLQELAGAAPQLCGQMIAAVRSDDELARLRAGAGAATESPAGPAARLGELTGTRDAAGAVQALELLRGILCGTLAGELDDPTARQSADLCERIAHVCATVLAAALGRGLEMPPSPGQAPPGAGAPRPAVDQTSTSPAGEARIVDELEGVPAPATVVGAARGGGPPGRAVAGGAPAIEIRDERVEHNGMAWIDAIARQLETYEADGLPFAVLLVELRDIERLRLETSPAELAALGASLEQALATGLQAGGAAAAGGFDRATTPWAGSLTPQRPGRCWLLAPGADRLAAHALADRISRAVAGALTHRGRTLEVLLGVAVCPQDGRRAAALAAHADIDLHAARAARPSG
ncbi:MAG TPA: hypothetical protein VMI13_03610 [Solirubrobacteraceae bacterium]|nr:hypothetical protein [Solirubrobacteraceae bacterium]